MKTTYAHKDLSRFRLKAGVLLFVIADNKILLLRRYQTGIDDGMYVVPMGCHDGNETLTAAASREAAEETGICVQPEDLQLCHTMHRIHTMTDASYAFEQLDFFFKVTKYTGTITNMEPHKCDELAFYPVDQLPDNTVPFIKQAIRCMQQDVLYSEFGWDRQEVLDRTGLNKASFAHLAKGSILP